MKRFVFLMITVLTLLLAGCKIIDTVKDDLEIAGYDVVEDNTVYSAAFTAYTIYEENVQVGTIYEFPTFVKARNYYNDNDFESRDDMTWVIHNQLIIGALNQDVINTIVN